MRLQSLEPKLSTIDRETETEQHLIFQQRAKEKKVGKNRCKKKRLNEINWN